MHHHKFTTVLAWALLLSMLFSACSVFQLKPAGMPDEEVQAVTENILQAIDTGDYAAFKADFSPKMQEVFSEAEFNKVRDLVAGASGNFQSCSAPQMMNNQGYAVYRVPCQYDQEKVTVTITFLIDGQKIEGLFFDSNNIRKATQ